MRCKVLGLVMDDLRGWIEARSLIQYTQEFKNYFAPLLDKRFHGLSLHLAAENLLPIPS
jgi:hypothetical protein